MYLFINEPVCDTVDDDDNDDNRREHFKTPRCAATPRRSKKLPLLQCLASAKAMLCKNSTKVQCLVSDHRHMCAIINNLPHHLPHFILEG